MPRLILLTTLIAVTAYAGGVRSKDISGYGRLSLSALPGFYSDAQLRFSEKWYGGLGMGYKPVAREMYDTGAEDAVFDTWAMYRYYHWRDGAWAIDSGLLAGFFFDDKKIGGQGGITIEFTYSDIYSLRLNPVFGPRAGFEFAYDYTSAVTFTAGITGISGIIGIEFNM
jgi:hypothetical protein